MFQVNILSEQNVFQVNNIILWAELLMESICVKSDHFKGTAPMFQVDRNSEQHLCSK